MNIKVSLLACTLGLLTAPMFVSSSSAAEAKVSAVVKGQETKGLQWLESYDEALKKAASEGKKVFINFTGSDWCFYCIQMEKTTLSKSSFAEMAQKDMILLKLDFPRRKPFPAELKKQNEGLAKKYKVRGYPTYLIIDDKGKELKRLSFTNQSEVFLDQVKRTVSSDIGPALVWRKDLPATLKLGKENGKPTVCYVTHNGSSITRELNELFGVTKIEDYLKEHYNCVKLLRPNLFPPVGLESEKELFSIKQFEAQNGRPPGRIPRDLYEMLDGYGVQENREAPAILFFSAEGQLVDKVKAHENRYQSSMTGSMRHLRSVGGGVHFLHELLSHFKEQEKPYPKDRIPPVLNLSGDCRMGLAYARSRKVPMLMIFGSGEKSFFYRYSAGRDAMIRVLNRYALCYTHMKAGKPPVQQNEADEQSKSYSVAEYELRAPLGLDKVLLDAAIAVISTEGEILKVLKSHDAEGKQAAWFAGVEANDVSLLERELEEALQASAEAKPLFPPALEKDVILKAEPKAGQKVAQLALGDPAPQLKIGHWINTKGVTMEELKGKVVLIDFWATWCRPCVAGIPKMIERQKKYGDQLMVIGLTPETNVSHVERFVKKRPELTYPIALDDASVTTVSYYKPFGVSSYPHAYLIDKKGKLRWHGHPDGKEMQKVLAELIKE